MCARCDGDDAGRGVLPEEGKQEVGEKKGAKVVHGKGHLDSVLSHVPVFLEGTRVIDENVESRIA